MVKNAKQQNRIREVRGQKQVAKPSIGVARGRGWANAQIGNESYFFLIVCVLGQLATILITWPTWQVRVAPPNLPWIESTPQFSCGILLIVTLVATLISPRRFGLALHLLVLSVAIAMDQFRCQPQILAITFLMAACVWASARRVCVWYLVAMWLWAGIHKFVSPDWFMHVSYELLNRTGINGRDLHYGFAFIIAASETLLGLAAVMKPKLAAVGCAALHLGIAAYLVIIGWNFSVLPWNFCTAIVGAWLLWNAESFGQESSSEEPGESPLPVPDSGYEKVAVLALLIVPIGMYIGLVRHCFAHALYSGNLPVALATHQNEIEPLEVWDVLHFPFPNAHKAYRDYFSRTGAVGDKLHIRDPRPGFPSPFLQIQATGRLKEISFDEFFATGNGSVEGVALDDPRKIYLLEKGNVTLLKRSENEMIYAVKFDPGGFDAKLLSHLHGLPNLEQIQLADCNVNDEDLKQLFGFRKLMGIGLNHTSVTDSGLRNLKDLPGLIVLECEGTAITDEGLRAIGVPR